MAKKQHPQVDEELVRQMIGGQVPLTTPVVIEPTPEVESLPEPPPTPELATTEPRRRRQALPDFEQTFMQLMDIRYRSAIYVSAETKRKVLDVVRKIGDERMTVTSYVENILLSHLELYKDEINRIHKEQNSKNII